MKKAILLSIVLAGTLFSVKPQSYPKAPGAIRLLTYNTHYCKGGYDPGEINEGNVKKLAQVIKALDADVIALQELDSASQSRGNRYLLREIAEHTGIEYTDVYANAARFDKKGSIGCGALVKKNLPIVSRYIAYLRSRERPFNWNSKNLYSSPHIPTSITKNADKELKSFATTPAK